LPFGETLAEMAASSCVASATTDERVTHLLPILVCKLTTTLPMVAGAVPLLSTVKRPL
jgi:hypothetical protein